MKKNTKTIIIIAIVIIIAISIYFLMKTSSKNKLDNSETISENIYDNSDYSTQNDTYTFKSTDQNKIERKKIEALEIKVIKKSLGADIITTLKNNKDTTINGVFMNVYILNAEGKVVTSAIIDINKKIEPQSSIEYTSHYVGEEVNIEDFVSAKIGEVEVY